MNPEKLTQWQKAMRLAVKLAKRGPIANANPRVGAVLLDQCGQVIGTGWHRGAGTPHAEPAASADARAKGNDTRGATLVVTLEPCNHQGRTGPCTAAIRQAGIAQVIYSQPDPLPESGGGALVLQAFGIPTQQLTPTDLPVNQKAADLIRVWRQAMLRGRPYLTAKLATSLDGRVAAIDGSSKWITGPEARAHAHKVRAQVGAIIVTTGTVLKDNPALTARVNGKLAVSQPLVVVVGNREIPASAKVRHAPGGYLHLRTHEVAAVLRELSQRQIHHALVEGGPALLSAFLRAEVVDEVHAYHAPVFIGSGPTAVSDIGALNISQAPRFLTQKVKRLGPDSLLIARASEAS
jgi:diaminohydroxyphosphoribosylaminopyrimidine deaminase/5-amino-6-(5-phosphoribosylamino)uracil reductase